MTVFNSYSAGTLSVSLDGTTITGSGTTWSGINARSGDSIMVAGLPPIKIMDVVDATHLTIEPWPFATQSGVTYKILWDSPLRYVGGQAMADVDSLIQRLTNSIFPTINGGSLASSTLTLQSTSGVGTSDAIIFNTGSQVERMRIDSSGTVTFNNGLVNAGNAIVLSAGNLGSWNFYAHQYGANANGAGIGFLKSRGTTIGSFGLPSVSDIIGLLGFNTTDNSTTLQSAAIVGVVEGTPGSGTVPARLSFRTAVQGAAFATERMRIGNDGQVAINWSGSTAIVDRVLLTIHSTDGTNNPGSIGCYQYSNDASGPYMSFYKSRATTIGDLTGQVANGDALGSIFFSGSTGAGGVLTPTSIRSVVDGATTVNQRPPGRFQFFTAVSGGSSTERVRIDSFGNCTFQGSSGGGANISVSGYQSVVQAIKDDSASGWNFSAVKYTNGTEGALMSFAKSRGASRGTNTIVQNGDGIGSIIFYGANGTDFTQGASIRCDVNAVPGATNDMPCRLVFATTADGAGIPTDRLLLSPSGQVMLLTVGTTGSAANAFIDNANFNNVLRSTSSLRYKQDVEPVSETHRDAVLALNPIWYRSKAKADNPEWSFYGMGAEDVAKVDPRLVSWGYRDEDRISEGGEVKPGAQLYPDGVMYDRVAILQIAALKARIEKLENQMENKG